jgi:hypothetical protein
LIYGFDTTEQSEATAALLLYVVYRSRDRVRFKISPDLWERIERFVKDSAKRSSTLPQFLEELKSPRRLYAPTLHPRYLEVGMTGEIPLVAINKPDGTLGYAIQIADRTTGMREFGIRVLQQADARAVLALSYHATAYIVLLVRDRLEREKPVEQQFETLLEGDAA